MEKSKTDLSPDAFWSSSTAELLESAIRAIAQFHDPDPREHAAKYGTTMDCELFSIHRYCWCEEDECPWCAENPEPNFHYKPLDLKVWWYKYIGRSMVYNREPSPSEVAQMLLSCLDKNLTPSPVS